MPTRFELLLSRRSAVKTFSTGALTLYLQACQTWGNKIANTPNDSKDDFLKKFGPIDRTKSDKAEEIYSGDDFSKPHEILWNIPAFLAKHPLPAPEQEVPVVIVGGGASGLFSAYLLRDYKPVVLEQARRFGGNAKAESWQGLDYALGSAYVDLAPPNTPMRKLYDELEWKDLLVERKTLDPVTEKGKIYKEFWQGEAEPKFRKKYQKVLKFFEDLNAEKNDLVFPSIPPTDKYEKEAINEYDEYSLREFFLKKLNNKIPPKFETALEHFCWSTYAGSSQELSAAAALNFLAQESATICAAPGGNAALLQRTLERLMQVIPETNFRASCLVIKVKTDATGVNVYYLNERNDLKCIRAKKAILSCPKFVAAKILDDIEPERLTAIRKIKYRAYMTANVLLNKKSKEYFYDLFMINDRRIQFKDLKKSSDLQNATDFVMANFADNRHDDKSILTLYRAFPHDGGRAELFAPQSYEHFKKSFHEQIRKDILPLIGLSENNIVDLRLTRWGHALPLAAKGLFSDGTIAAIRKPFRDKVYFVEQDNWIYPALYTGATEADYWCKVIRDGLNS